MTSFRAAIDIHGLRPGRAPEEVMETAVEAVKSVRLVEANQLDVIGGVPRITVRLMVTASTYHGENDDARFTALTMRSAVNRVAITGGMRVTRRVRGRWEGV